MPGVQVLRHLEKKVCCGHPLCLSPGLVIPLVLL